MCKLSSLADKSVEYLLGKADIKPNEIPRDLDKLLKALNIIATYMDFSHIESILSAKVEEWGPILGAVAVKRGNIGIFYRQGSTPNRMRFTVAHELAHCCLHNADLEKGHVLMRYDGYFSDEKEFEANDFASELLMPEVLLREDYKNKRFVRLIDAAKYYQVSVNVMEVRLLRLGLLENLRSGQINE